MQVLFRAKYFGIHLYCPANESRAQDAKAFLGLQRLVTELANGNRIIAANASMNMDQLQPCRGIPAPVLAGFIDLFRPVLHKMEQIAKMPSSPPSLHDRFICDSYVARGEFKEAKCILQDFEPCPEGHRSYLYDDFHPLNDVPRRQPDGRLPFFEPAEVRIIGPPEFALHNKVTRVFANGQIYMYRDVRKRLNSVVNHEIERYVCLQSAGFHSDVRFTKLAGVVVDHRRPGHPRFLGLLLENMHDIGRLDSFLANVPNLPTVMRLEIAKQLSGTLRALHERSIVWGAAAPRNVIVDQVGNAFITNFSGFADEDLNKESVSTDSMHADMRGMERMLRLLMAESGMHSRVASAGSNRFR
ncbi:hypothetical protein PWT90_08418 [Aphanocladium album]|nr:hypothetical protein PWT90_08418 [Aphanocladium album]